MTVASFEFAIFEGVRAVHKASDLLSPKFAQLGVGTVVLSDTGGTLDLGGAQLSGSQLAAGQVVVGNASNVGVAVTLAGDATLDDTGLLTIANLAVTGAKLGTGAVTNDKLANNVAGVGLSRNGTTLALDVLVDGETLSIVNGVLQIQTSGVDTTQLNNGAVTVIKLSPGLQTEIGNHETRITNLENEVAQLTAALAAIQANTPVQQIFTSADSQTDFTLTLFTLSADNTVLDVEARIDGRVQTQDTSGSTTESFYKVSPTLMRFSAPLPAGKEVVFFKRGTASGPAVIQNVTDAALTNITVPVAPNVNGAEPLGLPQQAWGSLFLKDTASSQVYQLIITNGGIAFNPV